MHQACGNNVNTALPKRRFRDWGRNYLQLQGFTDHIEDILWFFLGLNILVKLILGISSIWLDDWTMNESWWNTIIFYMICFFSWDNFYIGPKKTQKSWGFFAFFFQDGSNKPCCKSSPPNPANVELLWQHTGIWAYMHFPGSNPESLVKMARNTVNTSELLMLKGNCHLQTI